MSSCTKNELCAHGYVVTAYKAARKYNSVHLFDIDNNLMKHLIKLDPDNCSAVYYVKKGCNRYDIKGNHKANKQQ